jgi:hypothetical protein
LGNPSNGALLDPNVDLLEASHAIHRALVLLIDWNSEETGGKMERTVPGLDPRSCA